MKNIAISLAALTVFTASQSSFAQSINLAKVDLIAAFPKSQTYAIEAGEVTVAGIIIKRVELGTGSAIITYFNKAKMSIKPNFTFRLIDEYGIEVARFEDSWLLQSIGAGEAHKEEKTFYPHKVDQILQFSGVKLPRDWATPVYLVIEGSQP